jgi:hypothetical protein
MATPTNQQLAARYGYALSFFNAYPELKRLLGKAKSKNWDAANFQAAIRNTNWWKQRSSAQRDYDILKYTDPGQWKAKKADSLTTVKNQAAQLGITLTDNQATAIANQNLRDGFTPADLQRKLADTWRAKYSAGDPSKISDQDGGVGTIVGKLKQMASAYGYPLGDATLANQTYKVLAGESDETAFAEQYKQWAKTQFAGAAAMLDAGQTVQDILDPYAQIASQELGVSRDKILANDPKWQAAINSSAGLMNLSDWRTKIRTDSQYGWASSESAQQSAYQMVAGLTQMFQGG